MDNSPVEMLQDVREFEQLLAIFKEHGPTRVLEVGSYYGGTLWQWMNNMLPGNRVVSVDSGVPEGDVRFPDMEAARQLWAGWAMETGVKLTVVRGNSHDEAIIKKVRRFEPYDFIFIDAGISFDDCQADFENYFPMLRPGGLIVFHDIACTDNNLAKIEKGTWWRWLVAKGEYKTSEIRLGAPGTWGIGIIERTYDDPDAG